MEADRCGPMKPGSWKGGQLLASFRVDFHDEPHITAQWFLWRPKQINVSGKIFKINNDYVTNSINLHFHVVLFTSSMYFHTMAFLFPSPPASKAAFPFLFLLFQDEKCLPAKDLSKVTHTF